MPAERTLTRRWEPTDLVIDAPLNCWVAGLCFRFLPEASRGRPSRRGDMTRAHERIAADPDGAHLRNAYDF